MGNSINWQWLPAMDTYDASNNRDEAQDDCYFIVPAYHSFSVNQLDQMLTVGQQPGVPFKIADGGPQRPERYVKRCRIAHSTVSIKKNTLKVIVESNGLCSLSFVYTARDPVVCFISLMAENGSTVKEIRLESSVDSHGPFQLSKGSRQVWKGFQFDISSILEEGGMVDDNAAAKRSAQLQPGGAGLTADVSVPVAQTELGSVRMSASGSSSAMSTKFKIQPFLPGIFYDLVLTLSSSESQVDDINDRDENSSKVSQEQQEQAGNPQQAAGSVGANRKGSLPNRKEKQVVIPEGVQPRVVMKSESVKLGRTKQMPSSSKRAMTSNSTISEALFFRFDKSCILPFIGGLSSDRGIQKPKSLMTDSPKSKSSTVNKLRPNDPPALIEINAEFVMHLVQSGMNGVFVMQDLYGLERRIKPEVDEVQNKVADDKPADCETDGDAKECVICLTDPRIIAPIPCRHVCLCMACADALPSHGNKCPICRKQATMLLHVGSLAIS